MRKPCAFKYGMVERKKFLVDDKPPDIARDISDADVGIEFNVNLEGVFVNEDSENLEVM